jgi:AAA domain
LSEPLLVVVTGMPASGKSTLARALAAELKLPLVSKDDIKERLYEELGTGDAGWSRRLGRTAYAVIFAFCRELLAVGRSTIAEVNFFAGSHEEQFAALPPHQLVLQRLRERLRVGRGHLAREAVYPAPVLGRLSVTNAREPESLVAQEVDEQHPATAFRARSPCGRPGWRASRARSSPRRQAARGRAPRRSRRRRA